MPWLQYPLQCTLVAFADKSSLILPLLITIPNHAIAIAIPPFFVDAVVATSNAAICKESVFYSPLLLFYFSTADTLITIYVFQILLAGTPLLSQSHGVVTRG